MKFLKNKFNSMLLCMMLIVAMAFTTAGCAKDEAPKNDVSTESEKSSQNDIDTESEKSSQNDIDTESEAAEKETADKADSTSSDDVTVLGEGSVKFTFEVVDGDGNQKNFEIHTDKESVADALLEFDLIAGEDSEYGLYVKTVNGITADYDVDQTYWAFYVDGEYSMGGVDAVVPQEGHTYSLKVEK